MNAAPKAGPFGVNDGGSSKGAEGPSEPEPRRLNRAERRRLVKMLKRLGRKERKP